MAMNSLKNSKSSGIDHITNEQIKHMCTFMLPIYTIQLASIRLYFCYNITLMSFIKYVDTIHKAIIQIIFTLTT